MDCAIAGAPARSALIRRWHVRRSSPPAEELTMLANESTADRAMRVVLGIVLLSLVIVGPQTLWGLVGLVPLVTGAIGSCPIYRLLGITTCPIRRAVATAHP
jgi:hypothetical protein